MHQPHEKKPYILFILLFILCSCCLIAIISQVFTQEKEILFPQKINHNLDLSMTDRTLVINPKQLNEDIQHSISLYEQGDVNPLNRANFDLVEDQTRHLLRLFDQARESQNQKNDFLYHLSQNYNEFLNCNKSFNNNRVLYKHLKKDIEQLQRNQSRTYMAIEEVSNQIKNVTDEISQNKEEYRRYKQEIENKITQLDIPKNQEGFREEKLKELNQKKVELAEIPSKIQKLKENIVQVETQQLTKTKEKMTASQELEGVRNEYLGLQELIIIMQQALKFAQLKDDSTSIESSLNEMQNKIDQRINNLKLLEQQQSSRTSYNQYEDEQVKRVQKELQKFKQIFEELKFQFNKFIELVGKGDYKNMSLEKMQERERELRVKEVESDRKYQRVREELEQLENEVGRLKQGLKQLEDLQYHLEREVNELQDLLKNFNSKMIQAKQEKDALVEKLKGLEGEFEKKHGALGREKEKVEERLAGEQLEMRNTKVMLQQKLLKQQELYEHLKKELSQCQLYKEYVLALLERKDEVNDGSTGVEQRLAEQRSALLSTVDAMYSDAKLQKIHDTQMRVNDLYARQRQLPDKHPDL